MSLASRSHRSRISARFPATSAFLGLNCTRPTLRGGVGPLPCSRMGSLECRVLESGSPPRFAHKRKGSAGFPAGPGSASGKPRGNA